MDTSKTTTAADGRDLTLTRIIKAPREKVYEAWTDPELLKRWFVPAPWTVASANFDVRPGGSSNIVMRGPDGNEFPSTGVFLEVIEGERLTFTDAYTLAWEHSARPFMTVTISFEEDGGDTRYSALVRHWTVADREEHEKMGFHTGWAICTEQLAALVE